MAIWNSAFEATPAGSDSPSQGDDRIRELKQAVRERLIKEHEMDLSSGAAAADGWHAAGSAKVYVGSTAPTTRPDGATALTADDDGRLWLSSSDFQLRAYRHAAGATASERWEVISGSGGGSENFLKNDLTKPSLAAVTAVGANSLEWDETATTLLQIGALKADFLSSGTGRYIDMDLRDLDAVEVGRAWWVEFAYKLANNANDLVTVYLYDGSVEIPLSMTALPYAGGNTQVTGAAVLPTTVTTGLKLRFKIKDSTAVTLYLADARVGPQSVPVGAAVGAIQDITITMKADTTNPTLGTVTVNKATVRRVGSVAKIRWDLKQTSGGTPGSGLYYLELPASLLVDTSKLLIDRTVLGTFLHKDAAGDTGAAGYVYFDATSGKIRLHGENWAGGNIQGYTGTVGSPWYGLGNAGQWSMDFEVPISTWSANVNLASDFQEFASNSSATDADDTTSFAYGPGGSAGIIGITNLTADRKKRVRFTSPRQVDDLFTVELFDPTNKSWSAIPISVGGFALNMHYMTNGTVASGVVLAFVNAYDIDVYFFRYANIVGPSQWNSAALVGAKWRIRKVSGGNSAEVPPVVFAYYTASAATGTPVQYPTRVVDTHNAVTLGSAWKFTAPLPGIYRVDAYINNAMTAACSASIRKNGVAYVSLSYNGSTAGGVHAYSTGAYVQLDRGDYVDISISAANGTSNHIQITRIGS